MLGELSSFLAVDEFRTELRSYLLQRSVVAFVDLYQYSYYELIATLEYVTYRTLVLGLECPANHLAALLNLTDIVGRREQISLRQNGQTVLLCCGTELFLGLVVYGKLLSYVVVSVVRLAGRTYIHLEHCQLHFAGRRGERVNLVSHLTILVLEREMLTYRGLVYAILDEVGQLLHAYPLLLCRNGGIANEAELELHRIGSEIVAANDTRHSVGVVSKLDVGVSALLSGSTESEVLVLLRNGNRRVLCLLVHQTGLGVDVALDILQGIQTVVLESGLCSLHGSFGLCEVFLRRSVCKEDVCDLTVGFLLEEVLALVVQRFQFAVAYLDGAVCDSGVGGHDVLCVGHVGACLVCKLSIQRVRTNQALHQHLVLALQVLYVDAHAECTALDELLGQVALVLLDHLVDLLVGNGQTDLLCLCAEQLVEQHLLPYLLTNLHGGLFVEVVAVVLNLQQLGRLVDHSLIVLRRDILTVDDRYLAVFEVQEATTGVDGISQNECQHSETHNDQQECAMISNFL